MKISLNWLKTFVDIDIDNESLKNLLTDIGLEVEGVEAYESVPGGLRGLITAEVLTCLPHENADKLKVTTVSIGDGNPLQIVCGAPNVAAGQKVVLAQIGAKLYPKDGEPFEIKKSKIRGVESFGMLCAEDEIGLGKSHAGIIVLPDDTEIGRPVSDLYEVENDTIFEIGLTPNRTDAQSHWGVARDLAAVLNFRYKKNIKLKRDLSEISLTNNLPVQVEVECPELAPRYSGLVIEGLQVGSSPQWLQNRLKAIGQKPINNVVDITNYILHAYGQPLHAFDLRAVSDKIQVKTLAEGTVFKTLDGEEVTLTTDDLMICNEHEPMCIAGVYGGQKSGVRDDTQAIFLESAFFDSTAIRKTSMLHGLRTEAAMHFEKGVDPIETVHILKIAARLILEIAGGKVTSDIVDISQQDFTKNKVLLEPDRVRKLTAAPITDEEIKRILELLEIDVSVENQGWQLQVPLYRADVLREVDVIEDILRIYGYNNIPIPSAIHAAVPVKRGLERNKLYQTTANYLVSNGFYEILNNSLTRSKDVAELVEQDTLVKLLSSINVELDSLRPNMHVSTLEVLRYNINRSQKNLRLFEYGKTYKKSESQYVETLHLFLCLSGEKWKANWITPAAKVNFYDLKGLVDSILSRLGIRPSSIEEGTDALHAYKLTYQVGQKEIAIVGKLSDKEAQKWDIKQEVFVADLLWDNIYNLVKKVSVPQVEISKFPSIRRDLSLLLDKNVKFTEIQGIAKRYGKKLLRNVDLFDVYEGEKIEAGKKSYAVSFVFRDDEKTLKDKEVEQVMKILIAQFHEQLKAIVRGQ